MSTSRETVRDAVVSLFTSALVGSGLPCKTVTGSKVSKLSGLTPLVSVLSDGTFRERQTFMGDLPTFYLEVQVWVVQKATGWTTADAEDALDEIEKLIAEVYESSETLRPDGRSRVFEVVVSGVPYYLERIPTVVKLVQS